MTARLAYRSTPSIITGMPNVGDHVAYFWIPLEQSLGSIVGPFAIELEPASWPNRLAEVADASLPATSLDVSLAVATVTAAPNRVSVFAAAMELAVEAQEHLGVIRLSHARRLRRRLSKVASRRSFQTEISIVEAAVTLSGPWHPVVDGPDATLTAALDSSLVAIKLLLLQVCAAQPEVTRLIPTRESLPALIPYMVCELRPESSNQPLAPITLQPSALANDHGAESMTLIHRPPSPKELSPMKNPFVIYWSLRNDAATLLRLRGQYRASLLLLAAAAENLLDSIGHLVLWADNVDPVTAAGMLGNRVGPLKRAASILGPRLGGGWSGDSKSPIGDWSNHIVKVRNEAVHTGADVTRESAWRAWHALDALRLHVGGLMMRKQSKYPVPALAVSVGLNLSSSPTAYAPAARRALETTPPSTGQQLTDFDRWQRALIEAAAQLIEPQAK